MAYQTTIAERLDHLMRTGHPEGTGPQSYEAVALASQEHARLHGGPTVSRQTVFNLRNGKLANPSINSLQALANVYGVSVEHFLKNGPLTDDTRSRAADLDPPAPGAPAVLGRLDTLLGALQPEDPTAPRTDQDRAAIIATWGGRITGEHLAVLRSGRWDERLRAPLRDFAEHIGIPSDYFVDDETAAAASPDLGVLTALKQFGARSIAMRRVAELPDDALQALVPVLEHLSRQGPRQRM